MSFLTERSVPKPCKTLLVSNLQCFSVESSNTPSVQILSCSVDGTCQYVLHIFDKFTSRVLMSSPFGPKSPQPPPSNHHFYKT